MQTLDRIKLKANDRQAIEAAIRLLKQKYPVESVILYGSKARGTDDPESDIDLLLLTSRELSWRERDAITDALYDIQLRYGVVISTLVVSTSEWLEGRYSVLPIRDEVDRYGVAACQGRSAPGGHCILDTESGFSPGICTVRIRGQTTGLRG